MGKRRAGTPEVLRAKRALKNYLKAVRPLFARAAELDHEALKALDEIAIELADNGELRYHVESIDRIAKEKGFETWNRLLEFSGQENSGLKETLAIDIRGKEASLPAEWVRTLRGCAAKWIQTDARK